MGTLFSILLLDRTLLFTSPLLLTIGFAAAHREERKKKKRNVVVVLLQPGCERVFVCALVCILVRKFSRILSSQGIGGTHRGKRRLRELKPKPIEPKNLSHFVGIANFLRNFFFRGNFLENVAL